MLKKLLMPLYRALNPIVNIKDLIAGIKGYFWLFSHYRQYKRLDKSAKFNFTDFYPMLHDRFAHKELDYIYFYQQLWAFNNIIAVKPAKHIDIGSTYAMSGYIAAIVPAEFIDFRPIETDVPNLTSKHGDILHLPFENNSVESLSCLHVAEHIGLGRYGDPINPNGTIEACLELERILKPGGNLYFSIPIGRERICFNAHRIFYPSTILSYFKELKLVSFSVVDDSGKLHNNCSTDAWDNLNYGCGFFRFTKE